MEGGRVSGPANRIIGACPAGLEYGTPFASLLKKIKNETLIKYFLF